MAVKNPVAKYMNLVSKPKTIQSKKGYNRKVKHKGRDD
jgi:hypothetical protein